MLAMSSLWILYFPHSGLQSPINSSFHGLWFDETKNGYWFTLVLFELVLIYWLSARFIGRTQKLLPQISSAILIWGILITINALIPEELNGLLMINLLTRFFPVFIAGAIASNHRNGFTHLTLNSKAVTIALVIESIMLYFVCWYWEFDKLIPALDIFLTIARAVFQILFVFVAIAIIQPWCKKVFDDNRRVNSPIVSGRRIAHIWEYLGRESLAIYLMHYFFLFPMGQWRNMLESTNLGFVPCLFFSAFWAAIIICVVLGVNQIIRPSRLLSFLMVGRITNQKSK